MRRHLLYWSCQIVGWSLVGALTLASRAVLGDRAGGIPDVVLLLGVAIALTHGMRHIVRRRRWHRLPPAKVAPRALALAAGGAALALAATGVLSRLAVIDLHYTPIHYLLFLANWSFLFLVWLTLYFGVHYYEEAQRQRVEKWRLEASVKEAALRSLKTQLNPHFLFNSLNSLRALIVEDPERAQRAVTELAGLLRHALKASSSTVRLEEELKIVRGYLELESIRLENRLEYRFAIDEDTLDAPVPPMLVQSLVENGIKHGIAQLPAGGRLSVSAFRENGRLTLRVVNSAPGLQPDAGGGLGLKNAEARLRLIYGDSASLSLTQHDPESVTATLKVPVEKPHESHPGGR